MALSLFESSQVFAAARPSPTTPKCDEVDGLTWMVRISVNNPFFTPLVYETESTL